MGVIIVTSVLGALFGILLTLGIFSLRGRWHRAEDDFEAIISAIRPNEPAEAAPPTAGENWYEPHIIGVAHAMYASDCMEFQVGADTTLERLPVATVEALFRHARAALAYIDANLPCACDEEATP